MHEPELLHKRARTVTLAAAAAAAAVVVVARKKQLRQLRKSPCGVDG